MDVAIYPIIRYTALRTVYQVQEDTDYDTATKGPLTAADRGRARDLGVDPSLP